LYKVVVGEAQDIDYAEIWDRNGALPELSGNYQNVEER